MGVANRLKDMQIDCINKFGDASYEDTIFCGWLLNFPVPNPFAGYCPPVWDNFLCWPPTPPGQTASLPCPRIKANNLAEFASRECTANGTWAQRPGNHLTNPIGWTNYTVCINPYVKELMRQAQGSHANFSEYELEMKQNVAAATRILEMVGLTLSVFSLLTSLTIFFRFRNLQNNRTRIHKNLFIAMSIQVIIRLIVYIDQYVAKIYNPAHTIETTKYICEGAYILLEYAKTAMFLWMFVEGLYLHNMIIVAVFHDQLSMRIYCMIGWGSPVVLVLVWGILTYNAFSNFVCWWGYNLSGLFWVLEGPRLLVIGLNLLFLLNIVRVLITKLRESNSTEAQQVRKAVRAAIVLVPLLGITNSIQMVHSPVDKNIIQFALWSYITTFLTSFQGFFCALIYCFLNGEVQLSVRRYLKSRNHHKDIAKRKSMKPVYEPSFLQTPKLRGAEARESMEIMDDESNVGNILQHQQSNNDDNLQNTSTQDPFYENWSDGELSSHNHVDVEQIEIPLVYFAKHSKTEISKSPNTLKPYSPTIYIRGGEISSRTKTRTSAKIARAVDEESTKPDSSSD